MSVLKPPPIWFIPLLSSFVALSPLAIDMYLPALPGMVEAFAATPSAVQLTISSYLAGLALFHLLCGPLADRYGRRPVLLLGLVIFCVASVFCSLAESVEALICARFWQGVGACTGPTLARAVIRDVYGARSAKALAQVAAVMALAPVLAPIIGGWMLMVLPWTAIFWFLFTFGVALIFLVLRVLPESLEKPQSIRPAVIASNYVLLLSHRGVVSNMLGGACLYAGAFAYISGISFVLIDLMGVPAHHFGFWFMFNVVGYLCGSMITVRYSGRFSSRQLLFAGATLGLLAGLLMWMMHLLHWRQPLAIVLPMALYTCAVGLTVPNTMAGAMAPFPQIAATASALMGFVQMGLSALVGWIVGALMVDSAAPMIWTLIGCPLAAILWFTLVPRN